MTAARYLLGVDIGTTSVKGMLVRTDGEPVRTAGREYTLDYPSPDRCELDPEIYWNSATAVIRGLIQDSDVAPHEILAVAFSSQGETLIPVDAQGKPLRKAIVWLDNRSGAEAAEIKDRFTPEAILAKTGQPEILPIWPATRIRWLEKHEPETFRRTAKYLLVEDFLLHRLTGRFVTEQSLVSSTVYYNIVNKQWWPAMLDFLGISAVELPDVVPSGTPIGRLTKEAAEATGLPQSVVVVAGAYDHPAGAIGCGNIRQGMVSETTGASMAMVVTLDQPILAPGLRLPCQCHAVPGKYLMLPYGQTAGLVLKWFKETFGSLEAENGDSYARLDVLAESIPAGSDGLVVLPHFMGAGSPEFNEKARGVFCGVTLSMGKGHFVRAILESVACMIEMNLESLRKMGVHVQEVRSLGGGARSRLWNQIKADCTGLQLATSISAEPTSLGAAILAGVGCGEFGDIEEACRVMVRVPNVVNPNPDMTTTYRTVVARYKKLYLSLTSYWN